MVAPEGYHLNVGNDAGGMWYAAELSRIFPVTCIAHYREQGTHSRGWRQQHEYVSLGMLALSSPVGDW